jgi:arylsulfatase A-like enzyme
VAEGVAFTHAHRQSPICTPSRASFLTGRYPSTIHVNGNGNPYIPRDETLVTRRLADIGYQCGLVGKLHLAGAHNGREPRIDDGYSFVRYSHAPRADLGGGHDYVAWLRAQGEDPNRLLSLRPEPYGVIEPSPERDNVPPPLHQTTWCTDQAIAFVTANHDRP